MEPNPYDVLKNETIMKNVVSVVFEINSCLKKKKNDNIFFLLLQCHKIYGKRVLKH